MALLPVGKRQDLIDLLLRLPNVSDPAARNLLLADLPRTVQNSIPFNAAPANHIASIVDILNDEERTQDDGVVPLRTVIENAVYMVRGTRLEGQLRDMLSIVKTTPTPSDIPAPPAQAALTQLSDPPAQLSVVPISSVKLNGSLRRQFHTALLSAFPTVNALRRMVNFGLGENLEQITAGGSLDEMVVALIVWAQAQGRTEELIRAALDDNPGNPELQAFARAVGVVS